MQGLLTVRFHSDRCPSIFAVALVRELFLAINRLVASGQTHAIVRIPRRSGDHAARLAALARRRRRRNGNLLLRPPSGQTYSGVCA